MEHRSLDGAVNAVAPQTPSQEGFSRALAQSFGRRVWLRMPGAPLRALLGEMSTLLLDGQNVEPRAALQAGYRFQHPTLDGALRDLAG
jgi:NAD dependent epimerase/dehydratase family enzyme